MRVLAIGLLAFATACGGPEAHSPEAGADLDSILEKVAEDSKKLSPEDQRRLSESWRLAEVTPLQRETFGALTDLIGKRFRGAPADGSTEDNPDTQSWQWALGGTAILIKHALADGAYGGDTYVYKDAKTGELAYVYITNAGFRTEGVMVVNEDGSYTAEEAVEGHPSITKVRSTSVLNDDGTSSMTSEYLDDGEWKAGHAFIYSPTTEPLPQLKAPAN
ncbi:MAG: hypothetical protein ABNH53_05920 [Henriciella sp.]|jgi:hypothetical protein